MRTLFGFVRGMLIGGVIGAAAGLLLAPRPGKETQELIQQRIDTAITAGKQAAEEKRRELEAELGKAQPPAG